MPGHPAEGGTNVRKRGQPFPLACGLCLAEIVNVKTLKTREFVLRFGKWRHEPLQVTHKGRVVGTWLPADKKLDEVNFAERVREYCSAPLPFTFAKLVKEGRRR
jgi:hypothetical protein